MLIVRSTARLWQLEVRQCRSPPSSPQRVLLCVSVTEPQLHLQWGWDTEHVSPICQTICQHSHNTPAKCGCGPLRPSASMLLQISTASYSLISTLHYSAFAHPFISLVLYLFQSSFLFLSSAGGAKSRSRQLNNLPAA